MENNNTCICCGCLIPEGRQICPKCSSEGDCFEQFMSRPVPAQPDFKVDAAAGGGMKMKFIKLTTKGGYLVYININYINSIVEAPKSKIFPEGSTTVGMTGDNEDYYEVKESAEEVMAKIKEAENDDR